MADCPKGKGKGGKGLYAVEEEWDGHGSHASTVQALGCLSEVPIGDDRARQVKLSASCKGTEENGEMGWTLVSYLKHKKRQGDVKTERRERQLPDIRPEEQAQSKNTGSRAVETGSVHNLRIFQTIEPNGFNALGKEREWEEVELAVDSGATETVVGESML